MEQEILVRRLVFWNRFWLALLVLTGLGWGVHVFVNNTREHINRLSGTWSSDGLKLFTASDGPLVVTHLVTNGEYWAALPAPIALNDSGGPLITVEEMKKMAWHDKYNQSVVFPGVNASMAALYYRVRATNEP